MSQTILTNMPDQLFKPGDTVVLKTDGAPMTVELIKLTSDHSTYMVYCAWYHKEKYKKEQFIQEALKIYVPLTSGGMY